MVGAADALIANSGFTQEERMGEGIWTRLVTAQSSMTNPKLDKVNPRFNTKYATLASIIACIRKPLNDAGLFFWNEVSTDDGRSWMVTKVTDGSEVVTLGRVEHVPGTDSQKVGSALTYSKRQSLCAAFGVVGEEDDDANAATPSNQQRQQAHAQGAEQLTWDSFMRAFDAKVAQLGQNRNAAWTTLVQTVGYTPSPSMSRPQLEYCMRYVGVMS